MQQGVPECRRFFESLLGLFTTSDGADATGRDLFVPRCLHFCVESEIIIPFATILRKKDGVKILTKRLIRSCEIAIFDIIEFRSFKSV